VDERILADLVRRLEPNLPDAMQRIRQLLDDEGFRDMCSEYEDGVKCLDRFHGQQPERFREYTELIEDLQQEILCFLQERSRSVGPNS